MRALELMESLDSSFHIERIYPDSDSMKAESEYDKKHGITDHKYYSLDGGSAGMMHVYKRDKSYEIHHAIVGDDNNEVSGEMVGTSSKPNMKFVGTMYKVASSLLKAGHSVRIVGNHTNGMFNHYNRLANHLAKKHGKLVPAPKRYTLDSPHSKDYSEITVFDTNKDSLLRERYEYRLNHNDESNNYGLGFDRNWLNEQKSEQIDIDTYNFAD